MAAPPPLHLIRALLDKQHGSLPPLNLHGPFEMILWEQVAYLANDRKRAAAFTALRDQVGLAAADLVAASLSRLEGIAALGGGVAVKLRAVRMQESGKRVLEQWAGDLGQVLMLPLKQALRELMWFPMIGKPGAEKFLLLTHTFPILALDSNGLRVLLRIGYGKEGKSYDQSYRSVRAATADADLADFIPLVSLHRLLRHHGQTLCKNSKPHCNGCVLAADHCAFQETMAG